jgi:hypothetical protein
MLFLRIFFLKDKLLSLSMERELKHNHFHPVFICKAELERQFHHPT